MATNSTHNEHSLASMGPPTSKGTKRMEINSLMSPPDPVMDSFSHRQEYNIVKLAPGSQRTEHPMPMSPPISPYSRVVSTTDAPTTPPSQALKDPVLYPVEEGAASSPAQLPLFAPAEVEEQQRIVDDHLRARTEHSFPQGSLPKREEYELVLHFQAQVVKLFQKDPKAWLRRERDLLKADRAQRYQNILPAATKPIATKPQRSHRADRVAKPAAPRPIRTHPGHTPPRTTAGRRVSATPEPSRRVVAPNREDKDFQSITNYCPPLDSLPNKPNSLKVDWKGQPIDLSNDPNASLLHPDELSLAGNLRLDCATYLTSKRRIFERRLQCMRSGKEFRKTDAQQACKIDVNKASKLWSAFEKVGWLDVKWMHRHI
ncbi:Fc.00g035290.m01.CDS01 [Cosmosporella sp. VM-42]